MVTVGIPAVLLAIADANGGQNMHCTGADLRQACGFVTSQGVQQKCQCHPGQLFSTWAEFEASRVQRTAQPTHSQQHSLHRRVQLECKQLQVSNNTKERPAL